MNRLDSLEDRKRLEHDYSEHYNITDNYIYHYISVNPDVDENKIRNKLTHNKILNSTKELSIDQIHFNGLDFPSDLYEFRIIFTFKDIPEKKAGKISSSIIKQVENELNKTQ